MLVTFSDSDAGPWPGLAAGPNGAGWIAVDVTPAVRDEIAAWCETHSDPDDSIPVAPELRAEPVSGETGLVRLAHGLTFTPIESGQEILARLLREHGPRIRERDAYYATIDEARDAGHTSDAEMDDRMDDAVFDLGGDLSPVEIRIALDAAPAAAREAGAADAGDDSPEEILRWTVAYLAVENDPAALGSDE